MMLVCRGGRRGRLGDPGRFEGQKAKGVGSLISFRFSYIQLTLLRDAYIMYLRCPYYMRYIGTHLKKGLLYGANRLCSKHFPYHAVREVHL